MFSVGTEKDLYIERVNTPKYATGTVSTMIHSRFPATLQGHLFIYLFISTLFNVGNLKIIFL